MNYHALWNKELSEIDPELQDLINWEKERQTRKLIMIPSESFCIAPIREATGSIFTNIYAEGYARPRMREEPEDRLSDYERQLPHYRRYANRRFYKGTEYVDLLECTASRRIAQCFENERVSSEELLVNVQPLSGAAANNSVYEAILEHGDTIMGMNLTHGGHLTHGSPFNRSGKQYDVVSYEVDSETERLNYNRIRQKAIEHEPKIIIAGWTSYPYAPDWEKFREIADACGALLMADVAHTAGLIIGGAHPSPVGYADLINFTTHKTAFGPRGAVSITTDPDLHSQINRSVFPGEQGGPHPQKFAAMALTFKLAQKEFYQEVQQRTIQNASTLAESLQDQGLRIPHDGTDTHLFLLDVSSIDPCRVGTPENNPDSDEYELWGEIAARLLDLAGIVVNKNTIPGDRSARDARGVRFGTPWITQRGLKPKHMEQLASPISQLLKNTYPFHYQGTTKRLPRGKVELDVLRSVRREIAEITDKAFAEENDTPEFHAREQSESHYPHFPYLNNSFRGSPSLVGLHEQQDTNLVHSGGTQVPLTFSDSEQEQNSRKESSALFNLSDFGIFHVHGGRAEALLQEACTADLFQTDSRDQPGSSSLFLNGEGNVIDDVDLFRLDDNEFLLVSHPERKSDLLSWLRGLSDGYILFDREDITRKVQGPAKITDLQKTNDRHSRMTLLGLSGPISAEIKMNQMGQVFDGMFRYLVVPDDHAPSIWNSLLEKPIDPAGLETRKQMRKQRNLPVYSETDEPVSWSYFFDNEQIPETFSPNIDLHKPYFVGQNLIEETVMGK